jgi:hypothetical protein
VENTDKYIWRVDECDEHCADCEITGPGWYFQDETERLVGPYSTRQEALDALELYAESL